MALTLLIIFFTLAVVGRSAMQYMITGNHGIRSINKSSSLHTVISSTLLISSFISISSLSIINHFMVLKPLLQLSYNVAIFGATVSVIGIILTVIAQYQMGAAWRIGVDEAEKTELITTGIYKYARNPIYTGVILFGAGLFITLPNIYMLISVIVGYISIELHVRNVEEPYLLKMHGKNFKNYMGATGRYYPRFYSRAS